MEGHGESLKHEHCQTCYQAFCSKAADTCPTINCSLHCGARFHSCKAIEHRLFCDKEKVPCINAGNGCPFVLPRYQVASHLSKCPASVVHCTMEWNRWPVYSKERCARVPFSQKNYHAKYGQLDVALALRDQRILNQAMQAPSRTKRALRNKLTQRFPAVPFTRKSSRDPLECSDLSPTDDDEEDPDAPWESKKHPPGLTSSVCSQLFQTGNTAQRPETAQSEVSESGSSSELPSPCEMKINNGQVHVTPETVQAMAMPKTFNIPEPPPMLLEELLALDLNLESITKYQAKAKSMYTFLCAQCFRRDEYAWHFQNVHCDIQGGLNGWFEQRCPLAHYGCTFSFHRFQPGLDSSSIVFSPLLESFGVRTMSRPNDFSEAQFNEYKLTRRSMSKEATPEVMTSINFSSAVHWNGVSKQPTSPDAVDFLSSLPFEILYHITTFLDGYSLCNLSLCNRALRNVCQSLVTERGMVVQEWEKDSQSHKWLITYQRWYFSTAFTSVPKWDFREVDHLSKHLKECPWNKPHIRQDPFKMHGTSPVMDENPSFWRPLMAMYPNYDFKWSPTFLECLKDAEIELKLNREEIDRKEQQTSGISSEF